MPSNTTNYNLITYDRTTDTGEPFIDFRDDLAGTGTSNMKKIDDQMKVNADAITANDDAITDLEGVGRTTETVKQNADDISAIETDIDNNIKSNITYFSTSGTNTYTVNTTGTFQFTDGYTLKVNFVSTNTGASTLAVDGTSARNIYLEDGSTAVSAGDLRGYVELVYKLSVDAFVLKYSDRNEKGRVYSLDATGTDTLTASYTGLTYFTGLKVNLTIANNNTGDVTLNVNSLGAKSIKFLDGSELNADELKQDYIYSLEYNGTDFVLLSTDGIKANNKIDNSFYADINAYYGNVKTVDDGQDETVWSGGTPVADTSNVKIGSQSVGFTTINGTITPTANSLSSIDFEVLNNGETSLAQDYLYFVCKLGALVTDLKIRLSSDSTFATDYVEYTFSGLTLSDWNYLDFQKADFTTVSGGADLGDIQSIQISVTATGAETFNLQLIQLVKKDPLADYPNPFQRNGARDFAINSGEWFVGEEFGEIIVKEIKPGSSSLNGLGGIKTYTNFTLSVTKLMRSSNRYNAWVVDSNNSIRFQKYDSDLQLQIEENGSVTTYTETIAGTNDSSVVDYILAKQGSNVSLTAIVDGDIVNSIKLTATTTLSSAGYISLGKTTSEQTFYSVSITEIAHAHHADIAEVAKGLTEQAYCDVRSTAIQSLSNATQVPIVFNFTDFDNRDMLDANNPTRVYIRESGKYSIMGTIAFSSNSAGYRQVAFRVNGSMFKAPSATLALNGSTHIITINFLDNLAKGDYIELLGYQDSGSALNTVIAATYAPMLRVAKIG